MPPPALIPEADWPQLQDEAVELLKELVRIPSITPADATREYPSVGETMVCRVIQERLEKEGIASEILAKVERRGNIVARLKGTGSTARKPPGAVLLLGHLDVVGIDGNWTPSIHPFAAEVINGRMYGRGTADMKSIVVIHLMTMLAIKRYGIKHKRDVILAGVAAEESGSAVGVRWLIAEHWDKIEAEFALNEGFTGGPELDPRDSVPPPKKLLWVGLEAIEKRILVANITATGHAGHASSEQADNSINRLATALYKLQAHRRPITLNPISGAFAHAVKTYYGIDLLTDPTPRIQAMFRDAVVPTLIKGGTEIVVLPESASVSVVCRLLPTTKVGEFQQWLEAVVAAPGVTVTYSTVPATAAPASSPNTALVAAYAKVARSKFGDIPVLLTQGVGTTDSFYLRQKGVQAYGIHPLVDPGEENIHGPDESIPVEAFKQGMRMIMETVLELVT
jgi:acetylornithine deacetylase/succinyl-diaminopimelate desuccinylase-like protein